jgi:cardiolipin synthase (CMP-forming)
MNLSNALTLFRLVLVPAFLIAFIYDRLVLALSLFVLAGVTDVLDGFTARYLKQQTVLGAFLDPLADKLLMTVSYVSLAVVGLLPAWLAVVVVTKDLFVSLGIAILYFSGQRVTAVPTLWGKQTTFLQIITVALALLLALQGSDAEGLRPLFWLTAVVTTASGLHYILRGVRSLPPTSG